MGFYDDRPPRHAHRSPAELAEDEILAALRGVVSAPARGRAPVVTVNPPSATLETDGQATGER